MNTYFEKTAKYLLKDLKLTNKLAVPAISRVVVSVGVGKQRDNANLVAAVKRDLAVITGQAPAERRARKSVSGFNVREGNLVGFKVTLRGKRAQDFTQRFVMVTLPRVRDFRGISIHSLDGHGNLSVGVTEQLSFPEIRADKVDFVFGVEATFVTTATTDAEGLALFKALGFPLTEEVVVRK